MASTSATGMPGATMSDHRQAPDLLDELLGLDEPSFAEEDQAEGQPEAPADDEPGPRRRRWWQSKRNAVSPETSEAENGSAEEPAEPVAEADPVVAEPMVAEPEKNEGPAEHQMQLAAEEDSAADDPQAEAAPD